MSDNTTLVLGASLKPERYSNRAVVSLRNNEVPTVAVGLRTGIISDVQVITSFPAGDEIHTVTMYLGKARQVEYYQHIIDLKPQRVIFNPGAENSEFMELLGQAKIESIEACTLVMLSVGTY